MATKINTSFYGAENTFITPITGFSDVKCCAQTTGELARAGTYTGGSFDLSAAPWGIGKSSVSSDFIWLPLRNGDTSPYTWQLNSFQNEKTNSPLFIYQNPNSILGGNDPSNLDTLTIDLSYCKGMFKMRSAPNISVDSSLNAKSTLTIDNNTTISTSTAAQKQRPVTYLNYQTVRLCINDIYYKPTGSTSISKCSMNDILNHVVSVDKIVRVEWNVRAVGISTGTDIQLSIGGAELDIPDLFKSVYYGNQTKWVRPWHRISGVGYWYQTGGAVSFSTFNSSRITAVSRYNTLTAQNDIVSSGNCGYGHLSDQLQAFSDVSYHWKWGVSPEGVDQWDLEPYVDGGAFSWETQVRFFAYMDLDDTYADKNIAYYRAILHEAAFIGLPIITDVSDRDKPIGDGAVYLPVFDDDLITTGKFKSGIDSLSLPNSAWYDVFSTSMPDYDPSLQPDIDNSDWGDLENAGANRHYNVPLYIQACNELTLQTIIANVNNYYAVSGTPTADDVYRLQTDFQGSNPADYIVACYAPFVDIDVLTQQHFRIGPITFDGNGNTEINILPIDDTDSDNYTFDCGSIYIPYYMQGENDTEHNDFRSYEPYTTAELYLPLCGTIDIDMKFFTGSYMNVIYYYDLFTMSCTAAVYRIRDGKTKLYTVVNGVIGVELPLTTSAMGTYQNNLHAIQTALKQNEIRIATSAATMAIGATATVATGGTAALLGAGGIVSGTSSLFSTYLQREQLQYELTHTQPNIGTTSAAHAQNQFCVGGLYPILFIKRALMLDTYEPDIYSKTIGNSCCINSLVGDMTGLIICSDIKCDGITNATGDSPTADEINAIKQAFNHGVIV